MALPAPPETVFRQKSRSFSLAARFFSSRDRRDVARLYCFCRYLDDLADETADGDPSALERVYSVLAGESEAVSGSVEADFLALARARRIPHGPALELISALREDCGACVIEDERGLIRFAYGVAGTVGRLMRHVLDAQDARADAFAVDLGIGLQLTNIVRDVAEDAGRGRFYLPAEWAEPSVIERALRGEARSIEQVEVAVRRVLDLSQRYYESARRGFAYIPRTNRRVIFLAAALYEEIGTQVARRGPGAWRNRMVISPTHKLAILLRSLLEYRRWARLHWARNPHPTHHSALHDALDSTPGPMVSEPSICRS